MVFQEFLDIALFDLYTGSTFVGHFLRSTSSPSRTRKSFECIFIVLAFTAALAATCRVGSFGAFILSAVSPLSLEPVVNCEAFAATVLPEESLGSHGLYGLHRTAAGLAFRLGPGAGTRLSLRDGCGDHTSGILRVFGEASQEEVTERRVEQC